MRENVCVACRESPLLTDLCILEFINLAAANWRSATTVAPSFKFQTHLRKCTNNSNRAFPYKKNKINKLWACVWLSRVQQATWFPPEVTALLYWWGLGSQISAVGFPPEHRIIIPPPISLACLYYQTFSSNKEHTHLLICNCAYAAQKIPCKPYMECCII